MSVIPSNRVLDPTWQAGPGPDPVPACGHKTSKATYLLANVRYCGACHQATEPGQAIRVLDASRRNALPTGVVTVTAPGFATDKELADAAGFSSSHFGYTVTRHNDSTATVALWND